MLDGETDESRVVESVEKIACNPRFSRRAEFADITPVCVESPTSCRVRTDEYSGVPGLAIYSEKLNFVFLHVPKSAGISMRTTLLNADPDAVQFHNHILPHEVEREIGQANWGGGIQVRVHTESVGSRGLALPLHPERSVSRRARGDSASLVRRVSPRLQREIEEPTDGLDASRRSTDRRLHRTIREPVGRLRDDLRNDRDRGPQVAATQYEPTCIVPGLLRRRDARIGRAVAPTGDRALRIRVLATGCR